MSTIETDAPITEIDAPAEVEDPTFGEIGDEGVGISDPEPIEQPNVLNLDEFNDYLVDLNGELVPVSELKGGGLRQADYTRKTQELADLRREAEAALTLQRSMQVNPEGTLQWLAQQHGLTIAQAQAMVDQQAQQDDWWDDSPSASSPLEQRLAQIEQVFQQQEAERQITAVFSGLKAKYGEDFNEEEVAKSAVERGIYDPNLLEMVYRDLAYEKLVTARTQATTEAAAKAVAEEQRRRRAAAEAAQATSAGGSANAVDAPPPQRTLSVREAAELAWEQIGGDSYTTY